MIGIMGISQHLLVFISVLSLTCAQTSPEATTLQTSEAVTSGPGATSDTMSTTVSATITQTSRAVTSGLGVTATATQTSEAVTSGPGDQTSTTVSGMQWPRIFYPFGLEAGDTQSVVIANESYVSVKLSRPFRFFGRTYNRTYVNSNGLLSFSREIPEMDPYTFPSYRYEDLIAPLWTDLNDYGYGAYFYQEYTTGNVLTRATEDIKRYYPGLRFSATWVFVATWDFVQTWDPNVFLSHSAPAISFQVVLISDANSSFVLMNYGNISVIHFPVEAGYDTVGSTHYFVIPESNYGNLIPNLKTTSNVNVPGRWAFSANQGIVQFADTFYPVGLAAGDTQTIVVAVDKFVLVNLTRPFLFSGRRYEQIYVNSNGLLSFSREIPEMDPYTFPSYRYEDLIAPLWTDLDDYGYGAYFYQEYTTGNVLTRATEDIKRYYPGLRFSATWVFVATWDFVETWDPNVFLYHSAPAISFQVVLISDGTFSFILMNYGAIGAFSSPVQAGYDTVLSTQYFVISTNWNLIPNLKNTSRPNVNVPGRWAFVVNKGNVMIGLRVKVTSFLNLSENVTFLLEKLKYELVSRNLSSDVQLTALRVQKIKP